MKRDFSKIELYLKELEQDIYPQPPDDGHTAWALQVITNWKEQITLCKSVLDVGCGQAFMQPMFERLGMSYAGVCLGRDYRKSIVNRRTVYQQDFHFLDFADNSFDLIFARHSLEHSPMPILALMEWHRVASKNLCVILPNPEVWLWGGRNHYSIMSVEQARFMLTRSGWKILLEDMNDVAEFRFFCEKVDRE